MLKEVFKELTIGWIWAIIPILLIWVRQFAKKRLKKQYTKVIIYKMIKLRFKDLGHPEFYTRSHHSLDRHTEKVFDESWIVSLTLCSSKTKLRPIMVSSCGVADVFQIAPFVSLSHDTHPIRDNDPQYWQFSSALASNHIGVAGSLLNGWQDRENWACSATIQYSGQAITLVADFSSLMYSNNIILQAEGFLTTITDGVKNETPVGVKKFGKDIFSVEISNGPENGVLSIKFDFDTSKVDV